MIHNELHAPTKRKIGLAVRISYLTNGYGAGSVHCWRCPSRVQNKVTEKHKRRLSATWENWSWGRWTAKAWQWYKQWIPWHINIQGNERADTLAKQGARCIQQNNNASYTTAKQTIKQHKTEDWRNEWANSTTGRSIYSILFVQGLLNQNFTFVNEKLWPVAWKQNFTSVTLGKKCQSKA